MVQSAVFVTDDEMFTLFVEAVMCSIYGSRNGHQIQVCPYDFKAVIYIQC